MRFNSTCISCGRQIGVAIGGLLLLALASCAAPLYTVAPLPKSPPADISTASTGGLEVAALALSDERALAQFDANLPLAGVIAVEVRLNNRTSVAIPTSALRISLVDSANRSLKSIPPKKALGRVMKYYGVRLYGKEGYARTLESYESIGLSLEGELQPSAERSGVVFFEGKTSSPEMAGYRLSIEGGPSAISIKLN